MSRPARFLVIRFSSIGDIVLTTPVLRALKTQIEGGAEVHYLTKKQFAPLLEHCPYIDQLHLIERATAEVTPLLKELEFDYIIDLHSNIRSRMVKRSLKSLSFTFNKRNIEKWIWVNFGINRMPDEHIVDRYMATLKPFGVQPDDRGLEYFLPKELQDGPSPLSTPYLLIAAGAAHVGKRIPESHLREVCTLFKGSIIIAGGKEDRALGEQLAAIDPERIINKAGLCTIHESAHLAKHAAVVLAGDTGMMHIAAAFKAPLVSVWGCTVPGFGMSP
ncbi:MAG: hypothetical protein RL226_753, partial [Bacteroidota bacterium]